MSNETWKSLTLAELVVETIGGLWGSAPESAKTDESDVLVVRGADFRDWDNQRARNAARRRIPTRFLERRRLAPGDLVLEVSGGSPAQPVGRTLVIDDRAVAQEHLPLICSNFCRKLRLKPGVDPYFVKRQLDWLYRSGHTDHFQTSTTNIRNLRVEEFLAGTSIVLPDLDIQNQISRVLDRVDNSRNSSSAHLIEVKKVIARLRQSILTAACSGRLTADWREQNCNTPPVIDTRAKRRPKQLQSLDNYELDKIPDEWLWLQVEDMLPVGGIFDGPFGSNLKSSDYTESGARVVRLENIGHLDFISAKRTYVSHEKYQALRKHAVYPGDIVFSSFVEEQVRVCVLPNDLDEETLAKADCFTLRSVSEVDRNYLSLQLACPRSHRFFAGDIHGATRPRVNTTQVRSLPIPLCSLEEQRALSETRAATSITAGHAHGGPSF